MNKSQLLEQIRKKESFLCIGLDSDIDKIPEFIKKKKHPLFEFNKAIIDATHMYAVAYKPNTAFYEELGPDGWVDFKLTIQYIQQNYPDIFAIADAKRADIGNTSKKYAKTFFVTYNADAVTVPPYMGKDSVDPFLAYDNKYTIVLDHTSNDGSSDLQTFHIEENGDWVYIHILKQALSWGATPDKAMFVVGATKAESFGFIREIVPNHFLLVPGLGKQGGDLEKVCEHGLNDECGLLINSSREIIFASDGADFAQKAAEKAQEIKKAMSQILFNRGLLTVE